jgi:zinc/manganese transport system substrate-binding protein
MNKLMTAVLATAATLATPAIASADVNVVATVPDLAALARAVGGEHVSVKALALPTQDPHFVDPKPSLVLDLNKADMLIAVGADLEVGWLPTLQEGARNPDIQVGGRGFVDCSRFVDLLGVPKGKVSRSEGDIHPQGNPHYLYDPRRARDCARGIAHMLMEIDPEHAADYKANYAAFEKQIQSRMKHWHDHLHRYHDATIVTYHKSWVYLADWLHFDIVAELEPKPGIPPSPRHIVQVIRQARAKGVKVVLQENYYPNKTGKVVADKVGATLIELPAGSDFNGGQSYLDHMDELVQRLDRALGKR